MTDGPYTCRPYQEEAIQATFDFLSNRRGEHPLIVLPTGSGKSLVMAETIKRLHDAYGIKVLLLAHVRELLKQNHDAIVRQWGEKACPIGLNSAGLNQRDIHHDIIVGGIQSVYTMPEMRRHFDLVFVDEAHLVPKTASGRYRQLIDELTEVNPALTVVGDTATHYRLDGGYLHRGEDRLFTEVAYELPVKRLIEEGWLCNLVGKEGEAKIDTEGLKKRAGDYVTGELADRAMEEGAVEDAVNETIEVAKRERRKSALFFACNVAHAEQIASALGARGVPTGVVLGHTATRKRDALIEAFKEGQLPTLINVGCLTTGFDAPRIDLMSILRPTESTSLYVQMMGRGMRLFDGKKDCRVLDYGGNILRHGPINSLCIEEKNGKAVAGEPPVKVCPECRELILIAMRQCPECGYTFDIQNNRHDRVAAKLHPVDWAPPKPPPKLPVKAMSISRHQSTKPGKPDTVRVTYVAGLAQVSEWLSFEPDSSSFARKVSSEWWARHTGDESAPTSVEEALNRGHAICGPSHVVVSEAGKHPHILGTMHDHEPPYSVDVYGGGATFAIDDSDLPF